MERDEEAVAAWKAGVAGDKSIARDRGNASPFAGILIGQPTVARQLRTGTRPPLTCSPASSLATTTARTDLPPARTHHRRDLPEHAHQTLPDHVQTTWPLTPGLIKASTTLIIPSQERSPLKARAQPTRLCEKPGLGYRNESVHALPRA